MVNKQTVDEANRKTTTNLTSAQEFCKNFGKSMYGMSLTLITLKIPSMVVEIEADRDPKLNLSTVSGSLL